MDRCLSCSAAVDEAMRFCPECGASIAIPRGERLDAPTILTDPGVTVATDPGATIATPPIPTTATSSRTRDRTPSLSHSTPAGRFAPGTVLSARYRIIGLLGRGGMGEIYRADDLKLDQPVALKFLPPHLATDAVRLEALYREVRVARQVSHPNVCRTYDIGETEGLPFISMEYVDGEDLSSLLRRIGRIPGERAIEIARQICAGLAAAHDRGVLHRDLKPSNVMIDGEGRVRITDFGLAGFLQEFNEADIRSGTPAYMAPEQIDGTELSVRSDLYSLGLVLYEMFTGKPAFRAGTMAEMLRMQREDFPARPSTLLTEIDPAVERVIVRCIEKDPKLRPASALTVAAALPGGDPLAAALAAGETPSPEMVAAAGEEGTIRPTRGWIALAVIAIAFAVSPFLLSDVLHRRVELSKPPVVLKDRAHEIANALGYTDPPRDVAQGLTSDSELLNYMRAHPAEAGGGEWLKKGRPAAIYYWYRQSPRDLIAQDVAGRVTLVDPPENKYGMLTILLDPAGRLIEFHAVPPQVEDSRSVSRTDPTAEPEWGRLFQAAGLDLAAFRETASRWTPAFFADRRAAWEGTLDAAGRIPVRIEAAAYHGKPVYFLIVGGWSRPGRQIAFSLRRGQQISQVANLILVLSALVGAAFLARRNVRLGRGDRRGAIRLAIYFAIVATVEWVLSADHARDIGEEWSLLENGLGIALFLSLVVWTLYLALEPLVRRRWPDLIISWTRLISGRWQDPMVGRDYLIGAMFGSAAVLLQLLVARVSGWLGGAPPSPRILGLGPLLGMRYLGEMFLGIQTQAVVNAIFFLFLPLGLAMLVRKEWIALGLSYLIILFLVASGGQNLGIEIVVGALQVGLYFFVARRYGMLASAACFFYVYLLNGMPLNLDFSVWYASSSAIVLIVGFVLALGAFRVARGRPVRV
jgi:hypothetical protein